MTDLAPEAAAAPAPGDTMVLDPPATKDVTKAVVVADGKVAKDDARLVIVVEQRTDDGKLAGKTTGEGDEAVFKPSSYGKGADAYLRMSADTDMGVDPAANLFTLGDNLTQGTFHGLSQRQGIVSVGPGSPIYAGINLAFLLGARTIDVQGATAAQVASLQPWVDSIQTGEKEGDIDPSLKINFPAP